MSEYNSKQKKNLLKKLKAINMTNEKDILNMKVAELKKINQNEDILNLTIKDVEMIWINKNANGIFIFDNNENSQYPFKLVFDVSDTHNYKGTPYKLWSVEEKYQMDIIESLDATFGAESENLDLSTSITLNAYNMVTDNIQDYMSSIKKYIKGTKFEEYSDRDVYNIFVPCVWGSVSYMMMTRCGINAREKIDIKEFSYIKEFNNDNLITILGQAVSDIAELGLREIAKTIKKAYNLSRKK